MEVLMNVNPYINLRDDYLLEGDLVGRTLILHSSFGKPLGAIIFSAFITAYFSGVNIALVLYGAIIHSSLYPPLALITSQLDFYSSLFGMIPFKNVVYNNSSAGVYSIQKVVCERELPTCRVAARLIF